jgi:hypothetical protein
VAAERIVQLDRAFRHSLDRLGITASAVDRRKVAAVLKSLGTGSLPGPEDRETLLYHVGVCWVRQVPGRALWLLYRFDVATAIAFAVVDREPVRVGD